MGNVNTIAEQLAGSSQNNFATLSGIGTTETAFSLLANPVSGNGGGVIPLALESLATPTPGTVPSFVKFKVRAFGTVTTGTTTNLTLALYQVPVAILAAGTQATLANDNKLSNSGAKAVNTTSQNWSMEATLTWDPVSQVLNGSAKFQIGSSFTAEAAITAVTGLTTDTSFLFLLSAAFSASNASNVINVQEFALEQL